VNAFRDGMRERGYVEGQNLAIEYRAPGTASKQDGGVAANLMRGGYDVILAWTTPSVIAARRANFDGPHHIRRGRQSRWSGLGGQPGAARSECYRHR
jgi:putative tryptophan/tyrosine transport system substrate-binding protein